MCSCSSADSMSSVTSPRSEEETFLAKKLPPPIMWLEEDSAPTAAMASPVLRAADAAFDRGILIERPLRVLGWLSSRGSAAKAST